MRRKTWLISLIVIISVPIILYAVLRSNYVQNFLVQKVVTYFSEELDTEVEVGGVDITFFLNFVFEDVTVKDQYNENMISVENLVFDIRGVSIRKKHLYLNKIWFDNSNIDFSKYEGSEDYNFQFLVDYFSSEPKEDTDSWNLSCNSFEFKNSNFELKDMNEYPKELHLDPNYILIRDLNFDITDVSFIKDTLTASIEHISFIESCGFEIKDLSGDVRLSEAGSSISNLVLKTNNSKLNMDAIVNYDSLADFNDFADNVTFDFNFKPSTVCLKDIGFFSADFAGKEDTFNMEGNIRGKLSGFRLRNFSLAYGMSTILDGNFMVSGLPDYKDAFINLSVNEFRTTKTDIDHFADVADIKTLDNQVYDHLVNLGDVLFTGNITGFINDFVAYGSLHTDIGTIKSDIAIYEDESDGKLGYEGKLEASEFDVGKFLRQDNTVGEVNLDFFVEGKGVTLETADLQLEGRVDSINLMDYTYQNIDLAGNFSNKRFNGYLLADDPNVLFNFTGIVDFQAPPYHFDFYAEIDNAHLTDLNIYQRDSLANSVLSTNLNFNFTATNIDDLVGEIKISDTYYSEILIEEDQTKEYHFEDVIVSNHIDDDGEKNFQILSNIIDFNIDGDIRFEMLPKTVNSFFASYMPAWYNEELPALSDQEHDMDFSFIADIKNPSKITEIFFPGLSISKNSRIEGSFNNNLKQLNFKVETSELAYNNTVFKDLEVTGGDAGDQYIFETTSSRLMLSDSLWMDNFRLINSIDNDSLITEVIWDNEDKKIRNKGHVESVTNFYDPYRYDIKFKPSHFYANDSLWRIDTDHSIQIDSAFYSIEDFKVYKNGEHIIVDGDLSRKPEDELRVQFREFDISNFDWFFERNHVMLDGILSGNLVLSDPFDSPNIAGNAEVINFVFNHEHLGNLDLSTHYDYEAEGFEVDMEIVYIGNIGYNKPISCKGYYYPDRDDDNFDLDLEVENLNMSVLGRYLDSFAKNFHGMASGNLSLRGPTASPELTGNLKLARAGFHVDYLNTSYTFSHELEIGKDYFAFDDMVLKDSLDNEARASGHIYHDGFSDFTLDIEIFPDNLALLNTTPVDNDFYYGSFFATGRAHIHGHVNNIVMDIAARTNRGTRIYLPLAQRGELTESSYITFVSKDDGFNNNNQENQTVGVTGVTGVTLNFDLEVTPSAQVELILDAQSGGDIIRSSGEGDLRLEISPQGIFNMYGDYTISEGEYLFTLQNMLNKRFRIEEGSDIRWAGDPGNAEVDIRALYRVRTSLHYLVAMEGEPDAEYRRRVPVDVVLELQDELFNPEITFDLDLPQSDEQTREMVDRLVATEQQMNEQVFSLLILNRFLPERRGIGSTVEYGVEHGMGATSSEMLSNQLSNWLSQISRDFDIGINYRPGDEISSQELEVALSTQMFDDRLIIDGNVGVTEDHQSTDKQASNIIGDVNIEYKITPEGRFRIKAFNRSNTLDLLHTNSLYTQGIGVFYRKEFDDFREIFERQKEDSEETPEHINFQ